MKRRITRCTLLLCNVDVFGCANDCAIVFIPLPDNSADFFRNYTECMKHTMQFYVAIISM